MNAAQSAPPALPWLPSQHVRDDAIVLAGLPLKPGTVSPRFGDDSWDLLPAVHAPNVVFCRVDWPALVPIPGLRLLFKELAYARLHTPQGRDRNWNPRTVESYFKGPVRWFQIFLAEQGIEHLGDLTPALLDELARWAGRLPLGGRGALQIAAVPRVIYQYASVLSDPGITSPPWGRRRLRAVTGVGGGRPGGVENTTPRIPEAVMGPYLAWALRFVREFAPELLEAVRRNRLVQEAVMCPKPGRRRRHPVTIAERLAAYAQRLRDEGRGVPDVPPAALVHPNGARRVATDPTLGRVNLGRIAREALGWTNDPQVVATRRDWLEPLVQELGLEGERARHDRPESLTALCGYGLAGNGLQRSVRSLQTACYIVVTYLSGMRDSEVQSTRAGGVTLERDEDGSVRHYRLTARLYKHRQLEGDEATWIVIEPVARAVAVLSELQEAVGASPDGRPFQPKNHAGRVTHNRSASATNLALNDFAKHVDQLAAHTARTPRVPLHEGAPWKFSSGQFRRTLAWYIVNQPFGVVAGAIQYKQTGVSIMQGYGGSRAGGMADELERERLRQQLLVVREAYDELDAGRPTAAGGGAGALDERLSAVREELGDLPVIVDADQRELRLQRMLASVAADLHVGVLNDCFFREEHAACKPWASEPGKPAFARCAPDTCANSRMTDRHAPVWRRAHADAVHRLAAGRSLPVNQRLIIEADRDRYARVLATLHAIIDGGEDDDDAA